MSGGDNGETLRDLVVRLIDNAREYLRAEIVVAKRSAIERVERTLPAILLIGGAVMVLQAASTVLVVALGLALARWIGMAGGMAVAGLAGVTLAGLLVWLAVSRISGKRG